MAGGMAHVVQHLPSKHKSLSLNPNTANKKKYGTFLMLNNYLSYLPYCLLSILLPLPTITITIITTIIVTILLD
jgi:hypothetical protein